MPSTRPTVDPVLDILEEMGYDFDELDGDGYKRSLKEAIIKLTIKDAGDSRIEPLTIELQKVKGSRKVQTKEKKTTISPAKFLTGSGKFNTDSVKPVDIDDSIPSSGIVPDRLKNIADSLDSIALLLRRQLGVEKKQQRDARKEQNKLNKDAREDKLEGKPKDKKTGLIPKAIKKPALNFFEKLKTFFLNIVIGAGAVKLFEWLKDPANAGKVEKFKDFLINNAGLILGGLAAIALLPYIGGIMGVLSALKGGLLLLKPALGLLFSPAGLAALALALGIGGTLFAMKGAVDATKVKAAGGQKFYDKFQELKVPLEQAGIEIVGSGKDEKFYIPGSGRGQGGQSGRKTIEKYGTEEQKKLVEDYIQKRDNIISIKKDMQSQMNLKESDIRESTGGGSKNRKLAGKIQTEKQKIREEYESKLELKNPSAPALIDQKNLETNIPGPRTAPKLNRVTGDPGQRTPPQMDREGGGGSSSTPKFGSKDPNNLGTFSTQGMYNMVG